VPEIRQEFQIEQPVEAVWSFFDDVPQVVDCMPGVELLENVDGLYKGRMKVKVGPIIANFHGEATITEANRSTYVGSISAHGTDRQGGSRASASVRYSLAPAQSGTSVAIVADISLQGAMARFGRTGIIQEVSSRLTQAFAECIRSKLSASTVDRSSEVKVKEVNGIRLFLHSLWGLLRRLFSRHG
jgi:carbon monoxide dehydrogenase subunit G